MQISLTLIAEDLISKAVATKLLADACHSYKVVSDYVWDKGRINMRVGGINRISAKSHVFFVLTDQDTHADCPPKLLKKLPDPPHQNFLYRFAVMEVEAWLLADRNGIAKFLSVSPNKIDRNPETISKPKEYLINLARKSKSRSMREDIVPPANSTSTKGRNYNGKITQFVNEKWDIQVAAQSSQSLRRTFARLQSFTPSANIPR